MKRRRKGDMPRLVIIYVYICFFLLIAFEVYGVWSMNSPSDVNVVFPPGTQILQETDTHRGFFRRKGTAITVALIPLDSVQTFGNHLIKEDFWKGTPYDEPRKKLEIIPEAKIALESENTLWIYRDEAFAFVEEPFSDWFAAIYDLDTGLLCYMEYDE